VHYKCSSSIGSVRPESKHVVCFSKGLHVSTEVPIRFAGKSMSLVAVYHIMYCALLEIYIQSAS
jgi:hypothetical protein